MGGSAVAQDFYPFPARFQGSFRYSAHGRPCPRKERTPRSRRLDACACHSPSPEFDRAPIRAARSDAKKCRRRPKRWRHCRKARSSANCRWMSALLPVLEKSSPVITSTGAMDCPAERPGRRVPMIRISSTSSPTPAGGCACTPKGVNEINSKADPAAAIRWSTWQAPPVRAFPPYPQKISMMASRIIGMSPHKMK